MYTHKIHTHICMFTEICILSITYCLLPVASYIFSSMSCVRPSNVVRNVDALFPIPPPFPWFEQISGGRRVSRRRRVLHAKRVLTNIVCCALSHLHLGFVAEAPPRGRSGQHLGTEQLAFVEECMSRMDSFCRLLKDGARQTLTNAEGMLSEMMQSLVSLEVVLYCRPRSSGTVFFWFFCGSSIVGSSDAPRPCG